MDTASLQEEGLARVYVAFSDIPSIPKCLEDYGNYETLILPDKKSSNPNKASFEARFLGNLGDAIDLIKKQVRQSHSDPYWLYSLARHLHFINCSSKACTKSKFADRVEVPME